MQRNDCVFTALGGPRLYSYLFVAAQSDVIDTNNSEQSGSEFSALFTIRPKALTATQRLIDKYLASGTGRAWRVNSNSNGDLQLWLSDDGINNEAFTFTADNLTAGAVCTVGITFKSGLAKLYLDGVLSEQHTFTMTSVFENPTTVLIGDGYQTAPTDANIWDTGLYTHELLLSDITDYQNGVLPSGAIWSNPFTDYREDTVVKNYAGPVDGTSSRAVNLLLSENETFGSPRTAEYINDYASLLLEYYQDNGATSNDLQDAEREFLVAQDLGPGTNQDMWYLLLEALGYSGTLSDMLLEFWCVGGGDVGPGSAIRVFDEITSQYVIDEITGQFMEENLL